MNFNRQWFKRLNVIKKNWLKNDITFKKTENLNFKILQIKENISNPISMLK